MSSHRKSRPVVTSYEASKAVRLQGGWQERYRARAREVLKLSNFDGQFTVCVVGRSGVGKGSLINHLLKRSVTTVSHNAVGNDSEANAYGFGRFKFVDVPGYDGQHAVADNYRTKKDSGKAPGSLTLEEFVEAYRLFGNETNALIFVVNNRITVHDRQLMAMAVMSRKFFCIVRTHTDSLARIVNADQRLAQLDEIEQEIRDALDLTKNLDIRIFKLSIPWPETEISGDELTGAELHHVMENLQVLDFPLLASYLSEPKGLYEELQIHSFVEKEVGVVLEPYIQIKKRRVVSEFTEQAVVGALLPVIGPVLLTFIQTLIHTVRALGAVGLVEEPEKAVNEIIHDARHGKLAGKISTKEGLAAGMEDTLIHIFGHAIVEIAISDLALQSADASLGATLPVVGAFVSAYRLPKRYEKIGRILREKACMLHQLWIMQNITNLRQL